MATDDGKLFFNVLKQANPTASSRTVVDRAVGQMRSWSAEPQLMSVEEPLVKIVPEGASVSPYSPFFTTQGEMEAARSSGRALSDYFGLAVASDAVKHDVHLVDPKGYAIGLMSEVAITSELNGAFTNQGGGTQIVVPNRKQFTDPRKIGSVLDN